MQTAEYLHREQIAIADANREWARFNALTPEQKGAEDRERARRCAPIVAKMDAAAARVQAADAAWLAFVKRHHAWMDRTPEQRAADAAIEAAEDAALQAQWDADDKAAKDAAAMNFPLPNNVTPIRPAEPAALNLTFFNECRDTAPPRYHVKGLLAEGSTSSIIASPKSFKTTAVTDIGVHLAGGRDWRGHRVKEARGVVYFAFERAAQVRKALAAYAVRDGFKDIPFAVAAKLIDMLDPRCVDVITATIRAAEEQFGIPVGLAVFDTWSKGIAAGGGSEDKAEHQNLAAANLRKVIEALPALHCMTVGHTGKDATKGERGSNATQGDRDVGILIEGTGRVRKISITYANELPDGDVTAFEGEPIAIGVDEDGEPVTAFIVSRRTVTAAPTQTTLSPRQDLAVRALERALHDHGQAPPDGSDLPQAKMVAVDRWREELFRSGVIDRNAKNTREPFRRIKNDLIAGGALAERDGFVWQEGGRINLPPLPPTR